MVYTTTDIEQVLTNKAWCVKRKEDELLHMDCNMYAHLGCDSSKKEKQEVRVASRKIYLAIKSINNDLGTLFLQCMDDKK